MKKNKLFISLKMLVIAAMLTAIGVVIGIICKTFLDFGGIFRITFENLPIILSGILFGPIVGGVVGVSTDLISYFMSAQVYPPNLIVTAGACAIGLISGLISKFAVKKQGYAQIIISASVAHIIGSMIIKPIGLFTFYSWAVLWRIPLYLVIVPIEIALLCMLYKNKTFRRLIERQKT